MEDLEAVIARSEDLVDEGKLHEAIDLLREASGREPECFELAYQYAWLRAFHQNWGESGPAVKALVTHFPNNAGVWVVMALGFENSSRFRKALAFLDKAEALGTPASATSAARYRCYGRLGDQQKSAEFWQISNNSGEGTKAELIDHYNHFPPKDGEPYEKALKDLSDQGVRPTELLVLRAGWLRLQGKEAEARAFLVAALQEYPSSPTILEPMLALLYHDADFEAITDVLQKALITQPENSRLFALLR